VRALLDTSVLIGADDPGELEGAIGAASLAELHFGALVARDDDERGRRALDLAIAATANAHDVPLLTHNTADFQIIEDLVEVRTP
jgi:toxin FitB